MNIDQTLIKLAESGLLGILLVITLFTIGFLYREMARIGKEKDIERDARLNDLKEFQKNDLAVIEEVRDTLKNVINLVVKK